MGRLRAKEAAKREEFLKHAKGYVPRPVLGGMGLLGQPPHCQISVPTSEPGLLSVTLEDIQNVPISAEVLLVVPMLAKEQNSLMADYGPRLIVGAQSIVVQAKHCWVACSILVISCRHLMRAEAA